MILSRQIICSALFVLVILVLWSCGGGGGGGGGEAWTPIWEARWDSGGTETAYALALQPDGKIVVAGTRHSPSTDYLLLRYNADGNLDTSFGEGGVVYWDGGSSDYVRGIALQSDGKILLVGQSIIGSSWDVVLIRYNANGTLDTGFGVEGEVAWDSGSDDWGYDVTTQADGKILVTGKTSNDCMLMRLGSDGTLDNSFGTGGVATWDSGRREDGRKLALQPDGNILILGLVFGAANVDGLLLRYDVHGSLDNGFGTAGSVVWDRDGAADWDDYWWALAFQDDGRILVAGDSYDGAVDDATLLRFNVDGSPDTGFGTDGLLVWDNDGRRDGIEGLAILPGGNIVATGWSVDSIAGDDVFVLQATSDGTLDKSFGRSGHILWDGGFNDLAYAVAVTTSGEIFVAGESWNNNNGDVLLLRVR